MKTKLDNKSCNYSRIMSFKLCKKRKLNNKKHRLDKIKKTKGNKMRR